jgi:hypothetical protein
MTKRILVVEDQEDLRGVLRDLLTGSGYRRRCPLAVSSADTSLRDGRSGPQELPNCHRLPTGIPMPGVVGPSSFHRAPVSRTIAPWTYRELSGVMRLAPPETVRHG